MEKLFGFLFFYLDQGSDGSSCWAFQDDRHTSPLLYPMGWCRKCGEWMYTRTVPPENYGHTLETMRKLGLFKEACRPGEHKENVVRQASYKGLHPLQNGDELVVCDKNRPLEVIWHGTIKFKIGNHSKDKQVGVRKKTWRKWFAEEYPAILVPKNPQRESHRDPVLEEGKTMRVMEVKKFHLGDVLSIITRRPVSPRSLDGVYDILSFMTGHSVYTHEIPGAIRECRPYLLIQFPQLAEIDASDVNIENRATWLAEQVARYGEEFEVKSLPSPSNVHWFNNPIAEAVGIVGAEKLIVVELDQAKPTPN